MVYLIVNGGVIVVVCGVLTSDRWCDSSGVCCTYYIYITGGVTVVGHGDLTSDRWGDISGMWCTY